MYSRSTKSAGKAHVERQKFMHYFAWSKNNVTIFDRYLKAMIQ